MNTTVTPTRSPEAPLDAVTNSVTDAATITVPCTRSRVDSPASPTFGDAWSRDRHSEPAIETPATSRPERAAPAGPSLARRVGYAFLDVFSPTPSDIVLGRVGTAASSPRG